MNISNLLNFRAISSWGSPQGAGKAVNEQSPLALAVQRADQRIQSEVATNTAQLSAFGQLKSVVSDLQSSAQVLGQLGAADVTASPSELASALGRLVTHFNTTVDTVRNTAAMPGDGAAAQGAQSTGRALFKALSDDPASVTALATLGLRVESGVMVLDPAQLQTALRQDSDSVQTSLTQLGQSLDATLAQELQTEGDIGQAFSQLTRQAQTLSAQQSALASAAQATSAYPLDAKRQAGLAAYRAGASSI